jgi:DNA (cytosine-5)-methyltransferase 1
MLDKQDNAKGKIFIDLFSGCGGLSLGLMTSGWQGLFAIEINQDAFQTLSYNLVNGNRYRFNWPHWLPVKPMSVSTLIKRYQTRLEELRGHVSLIAGGPPCQGFSTAGRRDPSDRRNRLTEQYLKVVELVRPKYVLLENVNGFTMPFNSAAKRNNCKRKGQPYSSVIQKKLEGLGYTVFKKVILCSKVGVPQSRERFIMLAVRESERVLGELANETPFDILDRMTPLFRKKKELPEKGDVSALEAISDLEVTGKTLVDCTSSPVKGFKQIQYISPSNLSSYQKLMRASLNGDSPPDLRLANHKPRTIDKFRRIHEVAPPGAAVPPKSRQKIGIKKHSVTVLHPLKPSATITTVPEDVLHYKEYRILTVRENARLQSFPDWFAFQGRYTVGGPTRKKVCPRYSQVANAVPPLLAEILGELLLQLASNDIKIDEQVEVTF